MAVPQPVNMCCGLDLTFGGTPQKSGLFGVAWLVVVASPVSVVTSRKSPSSEDGANILHLSTGLMSLGGSD